MCQNLNHNDAIYFFSAYSLLKLKKELGVDDLFKNAIENLYEQKRILPETRKKMMQELYEPLKEAVETGFSKSIKVEYNSPNYEFLKQLKTNAAVFAAFKNHARAKEIAALLIDENGNKRSKEDFKKEALKISKNYNERYLDVEYDAATKQARSAAQYIKALETERLFPNIKYMPSVSAEKRETHMKYYNLVLPIKHPLWDKILPIKEFGCKCWWKVTDEEASELPDDFKALNPHDGLGVHSGKTGQVFDLKNSSYIKSVAPELQPKLIKEAENMVNEQEAMEAPYFTIHTDKTTGATIEAHPYGMLKNDDFKTNFDKAKKLLKQFKGIEKIEVLPDVPAEYPDLRKKLVPFFKGTSAADYRIDGKLFDLKENGKEPAGKKTIKQKFSRAREQADGMVLHIDDTNYISREELYRQINSKYTEKGGEYYTFELYLYYDRKWDYFNKEKWQEFYKKHQESQNPD